MKFAPSLFTVALISAFAVSASAQTAASSPTRAEVKAEAAAANKAGTTEKGTASKGQDMPKKPAPHEPYEDFILDGTARDVDLVWYTTRVALCNGLNINDRRHFEKGGWIAFDPGADDPTAIADALAQRSTQ